MRRALLLLLASSSIFACSAGSNRDDGTGVLDGATGDGGLQTDGGADGPVVLQELDLTPLNATVFIDTAKTPVVAATVKYTGALKGEDVTSELALTLDDPALGTFAGTELTTATALPGGVLGVTTVVTGKARGKTGTANLTIAALRTSGDARDFFFLEPFKSPPSPSKDVLKFGTNIQQIDVAFNVDTTGSMGGAIDNFRTNLSSIFDEFKKSIKNVGLAVVDFKDEGDVWVTKVLQPITTDLTKAKSAAALLSASGGGDEPEADICSMMHVVTGKGCMTTPAHTPAPGTFGAVDFRPGALPVVVNVTDAHWHDPSGAYGLEKDLMPAFKAANVRFVGVTEMHYASADLEDLANYLSDYSSSNVPPSAFTGCTAGKCCTGLAGAERDVAGPKKQCRLNFQIKDGSGLSTQVAKAVAALSVGSAFDVTAVPSNDPENPDGVDAPAAFIAGLRAMDEGDASRGCPPTAAKDTNGDGVKDTFLAVPVGTPVCFEVLPKTNLVVPPKEKAQFFKAFIDVLGMPGSVKLDRRFVLFLVPPTDPIAR